MLIYRYYPSKEYGNVTTVAGSWAGNTQRMATGVLCRHVYVKSATPATSFNVIVTDFNGVEVRRWLGATGEINDLTPWLAEGIVTVTIGSATADEDFEVLLMFSHGEVG